MALETSTNQKQPPPAPPPKPAKKKSQYNGSGGSETQRKFISAEEPLPEEKVLIMTNGRQSTEFEDYVNNGGGGGGSISPFAVNQYYGVNNQNHRSSIASGISNTNSLRSEPVVLGLPNGDIYSSSRRPPSRLSVATTSIVPVTSAVHYYNTMSASSSVYNGGGGIHPTEQEHHHHHDFSEFNNDRLIMQGNGGGGMMSNRNDGGGVGLYYTNDARFNSQHRASSRGTPPPTTSTTTPSSSAFRPVEPSVYRSVMTNGGSAVVDSSVIITSGAAAKALNPQRDRSEVGVLYQNGKAVGGDQRGEYARLKKKVENGGNPGGVATVAIRGRRRRRDAESFKVIAFICGIFAAVLLVMGLASSEWLITTGYRQGLFVYCTNGNETVPFVSDPTIAVDGCRRIDLRHQGYTLPAAAFCLVALLVDVFGTLLTALGLRCRDPNKKYKYYRIAVYVMALALVSILAALVIYPVCFAQIMEQSKRPFWEFGWAYGVGWGASIFLFGGVILLLCDKESEEIYYKERTITKYEDNASKS